MNDAATTGSETGILASETSRKANKTAALPPGPNPRRGARDKARDIPKVKYDDTGKMTLMASGGGYVMVRRPHCAPTTRTIKEWLTLSDKPWSDTGEGISDHEVSGK